MKIPNTLPELYNFVQESFVSNHDRFHFRGDTLFVLAELVVENMCLLFKSAHEYSIVVAEAANMYPVLTRRDLERCEPLMQEIRLLCRAPYLRLSDRVAQIEATANAILGDNIPLRESIIRRLTRRAGVGRMSNEAYEFSFRAMVYVIYMLIRPACFALLDNKDPNSANGKRLLVGKQTIRTVPPLPTTNDGVVYFHTVVPGQIEEAARSLFPLGTCKVYGNFWLLQDADEDPSERFDAMDAAMANAEAQYEFEDEDRMEDLVVMTESGPEEVEMNLSDEESDIDEWLAELEESSDMGDSDDDETS